MKMKILLMISCFLPSLLFAQKRSYVQFGPAAYLKNSKVAVGGSIGAGSSSGVGGLGITIEVLSFEKKPVIPIYADLRGYFSKKINSPYITLQPGYNFRNKKTTLSGQYYTLEKGGLFFGAGLGFMAISKKPGVNFQLKYTLMASKIKNIQNSRTISTENKSDSFVGISAYIII